MKRYICDEIVKGATHVRNQMPCQDNKRIVEISDKIAIIAVADGHGSSKCPRSDRGSMIAVNSFYEVMKNYLKVYGEDEAGLSNLITFLNREGDMRFAQDVCEEWQARVKQSFYKNKVDGMTDEDGNIKWSSVFSLYGTTLLGMLVTDSFVFSFQIGDGDISVVTKDEVAPLVEPEKFLGTETHSLSKPMPGEKLWHRCGDGKWKAKSHICTFFLQMDLQIVILLMKSIRRHVRIICR